MKNYLIVAAGLIVGWIVSDIKDNSRVADPIVSKSDLWQNIFLLNYPDTKKIPLTDIKKNGYPKLPSGVYTSAIIGDTLYIASGYRKP